MPAQKRPVGEKHPSINELFKKATGATKRKPIVKTHWVVRQIAGPQKHADKVFYCMDVVEAVRQFFCWHGLTGQTYRYRVRAVQIPSDHPAAKEVVEALSPRTKDELTLEALQKEQFEDQERIIKSGEAASAIA